jgi:hypothetical protein
LCYDQGIETNKPESTMKYIYIVIDSQGTILGAFSKQESAQAAADAHIYFCRISTEPIITK